MNCHIKVCCPSNIIYNSWFTWPLVFLLTKDKDRKQEGNEIKRNNLSEKQNYCKKHTNRPTLEKKILKPSKIAYIAR